MTSTFRQRGHPLPLPLIAVWVLVLAVIVLLALLSGPAPTAARAVTGFPAASMAPAAWGWPLAPPHPVVRVFDPPPTPYAAGHRGIDIAAGPGATVLAPADGVVSFAGLVVDRPIVSVRHADGLVSSIEPVAAGVVSGEAVARGQPLGVVASGGHCDRRCVHLGVRLHGGYLNPLALLARIERAVLLPMGR